MDDVERWKAAHDKTMSLEEALYDTLDGHEGLGEYAEAVYEMRVVGYRLHDQLRGAVEALYNAHEFISRVTAWEGTDESEKAEALREIAHVLPPKG